MVKYTEVAGRMILGESKPPAGELRMMNDSGVLQDFQVIEESCMICVGFADALSLICGQFMHGLLIVYPRVHAYLMQDRKKGKSRMRMMRSFNWSAERRTYFLRRSYPGIHKTPVLASSGSLNDVGGNCRGSTCGRGSTTAKLVLVSLVLFIREHDGPHPSCNG